MKSKFILKYLVLAVVLAGLGLFMSSRAEAQFLVKVKLETSLGEIVMELDSVKAPKSVANFLEYVDEGFYDGTVFHRIVPGFVIQGGGLTPDLKEKDTRAPIVNEADNGLKNDRYTVAMARTPDPHSATSQFYINLVDNRGLNYKAKTEEGWGYAVFGKVISGQDVVNKIAGVATRQSVPLEPVIIIKAERVDN